MTIIQYCHYVAGLVGIGLTQLFVASGLEDPSIGENIKLANSMGLFLQKTNIIRDYLEDIIQDREFWPKEVCIIINSTNFVYVYCNRSGVTLPLI